MFEPQFLPLDNGFRELEATPMESPSWEADPLQFPFESGVSWSKLALDTYDYDIGGPPDVLNIQAEPSSENSGSIVLAGPSILTEVARNTDYAAQFNGTDALYEDSNDTASTFKDGDNWTVFSVVCPRTFGSVGGQDSDGNGLWTFSDYFVGLSMYNGGAGDNLRLFAYDAGGAVAHFVDVPVYSGRWIVSVSSLGRDLVLRHQVGLDRSGSAAMPSKPNTGVTVVQFGYNSSALLYGQFDLAVYAVAKSGSIPATRIRDMVRYLERRYGPQTPCIALSNGSYIQVDRERPRGRRIVLNSGSFSQSATTGKSIVLSAGQWAEATNEEDVIVPLSV